MVLVFKINPDYWDVILNLNPQLYLESKNIENYKHSQKDIFFFWQRKKENLQKFMQVPIIMFYIPIREYFAKTRAVVTKP